MLLTATDITRLLCDLLSSELSQLRANNLALNFTPDSRLDAPEWQLDSIEFMQLASAVNQQFHLHETGLEDNLLRQRSIQGWVEVVTTAWEHSGTQITFRTSGSQGRHKACCHPLSYLQQEVVEALTPLFSDCQRIISLVPCHHIYGFLFTVLLPKFLKIKVLDARQLSVGQLAQTLSAGDLLVSFPLNWHYLAESLPNLPAGIVGVTSTAPCPADLILRLQQQGLQYMVEVYGASETAGIGWRQQPDQPYQLFPYWQRQALTADEYGLRRGLPNGEYSTVQPLLDVLQWQDTQRFYPMQRQDGAVQVAGINVFPEQIAAKLRQHPQVQDCAVRLWQTTNPRLKAFIIPITDVETQQLQADLTQWCAEHFSVAQRPVHFTFGQQLPSNAMGKLQDWQP